ncbi:hypothetical protein [Hymenobacter saemangeumensis]
MKTHNPKARLIPLLLVSLLTMHSAFSQAPNKINSNTDAYKPERTGMPLYFGKTITIVKLDPLAGIPIGDIPFDRNFYIRMYYEGAAPTRVYLVEGSLDPGDVNQIQLGFAEINKDLYPDDTFLKGSFKAIDILIPPLKPNAKVILVTSTSFLDTPQGALLLNDYLKLFEAIHEGDKQKIDDAFLITDDKRKALNDLSRPILADWVTYYQDNLKKLYDNNNSSKVQETITRVPFIIEEVIEGGKKAKKRKMLFNFINASNAIQQQVIGLTTSAPLNLVADAGVVVAGMQKDFTVVVPYVGLTYSVRALDPDIPFKLLTGRVKCYERLSINAGLTLSSFAKSPYRADLFGGRNVLVGLGYKFSHAVSLNSGIAFYQQLDPNPLTDEQSVGVAPYAGISINLKLEAILGQVGKIFQIK